MADRWSSSRAERAARNERMADLYEDGWTLVELADEFGLNNKHIHRVLVGMGVEMRPRGPLPGTVPVWTRRGSYGQEGQ